MLLIRARFESMRPAVAKIEWPIIDILLYHRVIGSYTLLSLMYSWHNPRGSEVLVGGVLIKQLYPDWRCYNWFIFPLLGLACKGPAILSVSWPLAIWFCETAHWNKLIINYQRLYLDISVSIWSFINYQCLPLDIAFPHTFGGALAHLWVHSKHSNHLAAGNDNFILHYMLYCSNSIMRIQLMCNSYKSACAALLSQICSCPSI